MIEAFRVLDETLGYSTGGCPPTFSWDKTRAKLWTRKGDLIRHLKLLARSGMEDAINKLIVERVIVEARANTRAATFLREFEEHRDLVEQAKEQRKLARERAGVDRVNVDRYVAQLREERQKDPLKCAVDALLKTIE